jgi:hypothetical protein
MTMLACMIERRTVRRTYGKENCKSETLSLDESYACGIAQAFKGENTGRQNLQVNEADGWGVASAST